MKEDPFFQRHTFDIRITIILAVESTSTNAEILRIAGTGLGGWVCFPGRGDPPLSRKSREPESP